MSRRFWHRWQLALLSTSLLSTATVLVACGGSKGESASASAPPPYSESSPQAPTPLGEQWPPPPQVSPPTACAGALQGSHATFNVGPGQTYTELNDVPWLSLQAGDVVNIYRRNEPYRTKFGLRAQGTAAAPVVINGVTSADCQRPEISGDQAVTATDAVKGGFGKDIQPYGLIQIFRLPQDDLATFTPRHIVIQNLRLTGAKLGKTFTNQAGVSQAYGKFAAGIYAVRVHDLTVENCEITGNGLGVFTNTKGESVDGYSANVVIRRNRIYLNGNVGSFTEHNLYVQARRALYEGNFIGQAYGGSSLKDRSSGVVIRYNKILASARALDLVETEEDPYQNLQKDPLYPHAWVYGNIIVNDSSAPAGYAVNMIHWGHDNTQERAHAGTLFFYHNTLISKVPGKTAWYVVPFQIGRDGSTRPGTTVEATSNIFWQQSDSEWRFLSDTGTLIFQGSNLVPTLWYPTNPTRSADVRTAGATQLASADPKLDSAFRPLDGSMALNQPRHGPSFTPDGATAANLAVTHQYQEGVGIVTRPDHGGGGPLALGAQAHP
jgi:hypothetical protein